MTHADTSDVVATEPQPKVPSPSEHAGPTGPGAAVSDPSPAEPTAVPGERLGVPLGATRAVADYGRPRPSYVFLAIIALATLAADVVTKAWATRHLDGYPGILEVWKNHATLLLAKNRGGAWGLLQSTSEDVRRPFFLLVSVAAIAFIMTLYRRLQPRQRALRWGLPLVLGGALGNVLDRIRFGYVVDFIDLHVLYQGAEHHWPTFNVADIAICVGVGLIAVDMFTSKRQTPLRGPRVPPAQSGEPSPDWSGPAPAPAAQLDAPPAHVEHGPSGGNASFAAPEPAQSGPAEGPPEE